ncbi:tRNA epoxyqueuosine(34) reductase QueG [Rhodopirellula sp. MGV]|nr:tRNA epoxyqueuosine(34) reductase QueG [Rhodopirellula sp. MGV]PNY36436.1 tRNA epoxyqueuosine(34) reductase QueG [Rhodopirellula baltica]
MEPFLSGLDEFGFLLVGICPVVDSSGFHRLVEWIDSGYNASMEYFPDRLEAYRNPCGVMAGAKSILVVASPYAASPRAPCEPGHGQVARYAWSGIDYHDTIHRQLKSLKRLVAEYSSKTNLRGCVDTAPLLERELAELAGLGWRGKNTLLLHRTHGSYFFLACVLVDEVLPYDAPNEKSFCGSCTACLDGCPTDAFVGPGIMDARKCISYLTIEHRGHIPEPLRPEMGDWVFGCDVCQEVCPWNRKPSRDRPTNQASDAFRQVDLLELLRMDETEFREQFKKSPFWRTKLQGMQRNAAIVLGNQGNSDALDELRRHVDSEDEVVAEACRWAIDKITGSPR